MRQRFTGVWKLIACTRTFEDGHIEYPYGEQPVGRITYDEAGRMSAIMMRQGRRSTLVSGTTPMTAHASDDDMREALNGFNAYFGTFDIDEASQAVTHHVQASLVPSWVGTDVKRQYRFEGDRLILTVAGKVVQEVVWEREQEC